MEFTDTQIKQLFLRLRQTREELLYDVEENQVRKYKLDQRGGQIIGVAHCDYVERAWSAPVWLTKDGVRMNWIRAGQVDDRVGVWLLLDVLPNIEGMPIFDVLLTDDEESGRSTAQNVRQAMRYHWSFQFDRHGTDFVTYDLASKKFVNKFKEMTGIPLGIGSFSDICYLPESCNSRVNIGTAYYDEHNPDAYVNLDECARQVERFVQFASACADTEFPIGGRSKGYIRGESQRDSFSNRYDRMQYESREHKGKSIGWDMEKHTSTTGSAGTGSSRSDAYADDIDATPCTSLTETQIDDMIQDGLIDYDDLNYLTDDELVDIFNECYVEEGYEDQRVIDMEELDDVIDGSQAIDDAASDSIHDDDATDITADDSVIGGSIHDDDTSDSDTALKVSV